MVSQVPPLNLIENANTNKKIINPICISFLFLYSKSLNTMDDTNIYLHPAIPEYPKAME